MERKDWSFEADSDILTKELELGKDLLIKASDKITDEHLRLLASNADLIDQDKELVIIFISLLDLVNEGAASTELDWEASKSRIETQANLIHKVKNFAVLVEN